MYSGQRNVSVIMLRLADVVGMHVRADAPPPRACRRGPGEDLAATALGLFVAEPGIDHPPAVRVFEQVQVDGGTGEPGIGMVSQRTPGATSSDGAGSGVRVEWG